MINLKKKIMVPGAIILLMMVSSMTWAEGQLTWRDALQKAAQNHPDLISAKEQIRQSQDSKVIAASGIWPQATANLSGTQSKTEASSSSAKSKSTSYAYGISGSQLIFDSFKIINNIKAAGQTVKASQENFQYTSSLIRQRLKKAFVNLLKAQELIGLSQQIYDIRKKNVDLITKSYNSGMEHKGALLTAQANLAQAEFEIHQAQRGLRVAQRNLLKEIGDKTSDAIQVQGDLNVVNLYAEKPDFNLLALENPQIKKIMAQRNSVAFNVKSDQSDFWPSVSLLGSVGRSEDQWPPTVTSTSVGLKLSWSLFEGGSKTATLDKSRSLLRDYDAQEQSLKDSIVLNLEQAWASLADDMEQVKVEQKYLQADEERAKISRGQYAIGLISFDNWTIIEDNLVSRKKSYLNAQAQALLSEADWIAAQGRTLEYAN